MYMYWKKKRNEGILSGKLPSQAAGSGVFFFGRKFPFLWNKKDVYAQKNSCQTATAFGMDEHQSAYFFQKEPFCSEEEAKQMKRSIYEAAMEKV